MIATILLLLLPFPGNLTSDADQNRRQIETFNQQFVNLILHSDHAGMLALWADDGVDLMPDEAPLLGKPAIRAWLKGIESAASGSKVVTEEVQFHNLQLSGDWASEWATEHQSIQPQDKPAIDGYGKIALVLHRDHSGQWKIEQEMWNQSPRPPL